MLDSQIRSKISEEIVRIHSTYYGRGPTKAKTYLNDDLVVCVLQETFTPAELTLIERGEGQGIQDIRHRFQMVMTEDFKSIVERATGRVVKAFFSDTDLDHDISIEIFLLGEERTDMEKFE